jgi:hypothetical protein
VIDGTTDDLRRSNSLLGLAIWLSIPGRSVSDIRVEQHTWIVTLFDSAFRTAEDGPPRKTRGVGNLINEAIDAALTLYNRTYKEPPGA